MMLTVVVFLCIQNLNTTIYPWKLGIQYYLKKKVNCVTYYYHKIVQLLCILASFEYKDFLKVDKGKLNPH